MFPNHPTALSTTPFVECWFCDPDNLGVVELRRSWTRKRSDPLLAHFADLAEPLADPDPDRGPATPECRSRRRRCRDA